MAQVLEGSETKKTVEELCAELVAEKMKFERLKLDYDLVTRELAVFSKETYYQYHNLKRDLL